MQGTFIQRFHPPFPSQAFPLRPGLGGLGEESGGQDRREQAGAAPDYRRTSLTPRRPASELQKPSLRPEAPKSNLDLVRRTWPVSRLFPSEVQRLPPSLPYRPRAAPDPGDRPALKSAAPEFRRAPSRPRVRRRECGGWVLGGSPPAPREALGKTAGARCPRGLEEEQGSLVGRLLACKGDLVSDSCPRAESTPAPLLAL